MEFKEYKRKCILLNNNTAMLIHILSASDMDLETIMIDEMVEGGIESKTDVYKEAAEQFINQLEENECLYFIEALKEKCEEYIKRWGESK